MIDERLHWFVARTAPSKETIAESDLRDAGIAHYLPRRKVEVYNRRRHVYRTGTFPLLPRYIFVGLPARALDFGKVTACLGVDHFIPQPPHDPLRLPCREISAIYQAELDLIFDETRRAKKHHSEKLDKAFPKGATVQARLEHLLSGHLGKVLGTNGKDEVFVHMRLGRFIFKPADLEISANA